MKRILLFTIFSLFVFTGYAQNKLWGVRASWISSANTLAKNDYNGEKYKTPASFMVGITRGKFEAGGVGWYGWQYGLSYRSLTMKSSTSTTRFNVNWVEVPVDFAFAANLLSFLPLGMHAGFYGAVPLKYNGAVDRYQDPEYVYGTKVHEKPFFFLGIRGGFNLSFKITKKTVLTAFASYSATFMGLAKPPVEGTIADYKLPLPTFAEFGISYMFGKDEIEKPSGQMYHKNNFE